MKYKQYKLSNSKKLELDLIRSDQADLETYLFKLFKNKVCDIPYVTYRMHTRMRLTIKP